MTSSPASRGFVCELLTHDTSREPNIVGRPLAGTPPMLMTYLLRRDAEPSQALARFIERLQPNERA